MAKRDCPDCRKRLQPFWMPASRIGGEVELDRCRECGGVWFDAGELTEASGKTVRAPGGPSARNCPSCGAKMRHARLSDGPPVDNCPSCRGTFVEAAALETLTMKKTARALAPQGTGFVCDECGARKAFSEGRATTLGLKCADCAVDDEPVPRRQQKKKSVLSRFFGWLSAD